MPPSTRRSRTNRDRSRSPLLAMRMSPSRGSRRNRNDGQNLSINVDGRNVDVVVVPETTTTTSQEPAKKPSLIVKLKYTGKKNEVRETGTNETVQSEPKEIPNSLTPPSYRHAAIPANSLNTRERLLSLGESLVAASKAITTATECLNETQLNDLVDNTFWNAYNMSGVHNWTKVMTEAVDTVVAIEKKGLVIGKDMQMEDAMAAAALMMLSKQ